MRPRHCRFGLHSEVHDALIFVRLRQATSLHGGGLQMSVTLRNYWKDCNSGLLWCELYLERQHYDRRHLLSVWARVTGRCCKMRGGTGGVSYAVCPFNARNYSGVMSIMHILLSGIGDFTTYRMQKTRNTKTCASVLLHSNPKQARERLRRCGSSGVAASRGMAASRKSGQCACKSAQLSFSDAYSPSKDSGAHRIGFYTGSSHHGSECICGRKDRPAENHS